MNDQLETHRDELRRMAGRLLCFWPTIDPSDIVQAVFLQVLQNPKDYQESCPLKNLRRLVRCRAIDAMRYEGRRKHDRLSSVNIPPDSGSSPSSPLRWQEEIRRLLEALNQLLPDQREAVELHYLQGWSHSDIAEHLESTRPAVAGLLHRGIKKLRELRPEME